MMLNTSGFLRNLCPALILLLSCAAVASADSIGPGSPLIVGGDLEGLWASNSIPPEGYSFFQSTGYTSPFDDPGFLSLGNTPGSFLFGPNNLFNYNGNQQITIYTQYADGTGSFYNFTFDDSGHVRGAGNANGQNPSQQTATPEPGAIGLLASGLGAMLGFAFWRVRRARRGKP